MTTGLATSADEQVLVRRVVTALCVVALVTIPVTDLDLTDGPAWAMVLRLAALGGGLALLGRTRLGLPSIIGGLAVALWAVALVTIVTSARAVVSGTSDVVGFGSAALYLVAGVGPAVFLAFPLRRALLVSGAWLVGLVGGVVAVTGADAPQLGRQPGLGGLLLGIAIVLATCTVVAWVARRSADQRQQAAALQARRAATAAWLDDLRRRRIALFTRAGEELRAPVAQLLELVAPLRTGGGAPVQPAVAAEIARLSAVADGLLSDVVEQMDELAPSPTPATDDAADTPWAAPGSRRGRALVLVLSAAVVVVVVLDAVALWRLGGGVVAPDAAATAANRMVVVLLVAAAVPALVVRGAPAWWLTGAMLLAHPVAIVAMPAAVRAQVLPTVATAWRIAVLGTGLLVLLAVVIDRRVRARDGLVGAARDEEGRNRELRRRAEATRLAHGEATHELRTPLTVVRGSAELLAGPDLGIDADRLEALRSALVRGVDRLAARLAVMGQVLPAPPGAGAGPSEDVAALLRRVAADEAVSGGRVAVHVQLDDVRTSAPVDDVEHVLENLLGNARKYGDPGTVELRAELRGEVVQVEVANRGGQLGPGDEERMFEPYWRASGNEGSVPGSGIGLALVRRLVEGWGGRCWAAVDGQVTRVMVTLPVVDGREARASGGARVVAGGA